MNYIRTLGISLTMKVFLFTFFDSFCNFSICYKIFIASRRMNHVPLKILFFFVLEVLVLWFRNSHEKNDDKCFVKKRWSYKHLSNNCFELRPLCLRIGGLCSVSHHQLSFFIIEFHRLTMIINFSTSELIKWYDKFFSRLNYIDFWQSCL